MSIEQSDFLAPADTEVNALVPGAPLEDAKCPFNPSALPDSMVSAPRSAQTARDWWPNHLRLDLLHAHSSMSNPMGEDFD